MRSLQTGSIVKLLSTEALAPRPIAVLRAQKRFDDDVHGTNELRHGYPGEVDPHLSLSFITFDAGDPAKAAPNGVESTSDGRDAPLADP